MPHTIQEEYRAGIESGKRYDINDISQVETHAKAVNVKNNQAAPVLIKAYWLGWLIGKAIADPQPRVYDDFNAMLLDNPGIMRYYIMNHNHEGMNHLFFLDSLSAVEARNNFNALGNHARAYEELIVKR